MASKLACIENGILLRKVSRYSAELYSERKQHTGKYVLPVEKLPEI